MMELDGQDQDTCIKVIGVGGGGGNAVDLMYDVGIVGVEFIAANTDKHALSRSKASVTIQLGIELTKGLGAGANPSVGEKAAQESQNEIQEQLKGAKMVFIAAGMGGGTGTGAAPVIAGLARQAGVLTVAVVTKPFKFEGGRRKKLAEAGIERLRQNVDALIVIPNERLLQLSGEQMSMIDAFKMANQVLLNAVRSISEIITNNAFINTDFNDVKTVLENKGVALMGTGTATGPNAMVEAVEDAIEAPLLDGISIQNASHVLVNVSGSNKLTMYEINEALSIISDAASEDALIIWGQRIEPDLDGVMVTIIATGFDRAEEDLGLGMSGMGASGLGVSGMRSAVFQGDSGSFGAPADYSRPVMSGGFSIDEPSGTFGLGGGYTDTMSSGNYPSAELARKFQAYDAEVNNGTAPGARPVVSYVPASDSQSMLSSVQQPVSADKFAASNRSEAAQRSGGHRSVQREGAVDGQPKSNAPKAEDDVDLDTPAALRRKRNFLDF